MSPEGGPLRRDLICTGEARDAGGVAPQERHDTDQAGNFPLLFELLGRQFRREHD
jgi:hypothetical protein